MNSYPALLFSPGLLNSWKVDFKGKNNKQEIEWQTHNTVHAVARTDSSSSVSEATGRTDVLCGRKISKKNICFLICAFCQSVENMINDMLHVNLQQFLQAQENVPLLTNKWEPIGLQLNSECIVWYFKLPLTHYMFGISFKWLFKLRNM